MGRSFNFGKRDKEKARQQKQMDKAAKRIMIRQQKADLKAGTPSAAPEISEQEPAEEIG